MEDHRQKGGAQGPALVRHRHGRRHRRHCRCACTEIQWNNNLILAYGHQVSSLKFISAPA